MFRFIAGPAIVASLLLSMPAVGQTWDELGNGRHDAGSNTETAQDLSSTPVSLIIGTLATAGDVDYYQINIVRPSRFAATTAKSFYYSGDVEDCQLFLYDAAGNLVYSSTDGQLPVGGLLSLLSGTRQVAGGPFNRQLSGPTVPGNYYLAVTAGMDRDAKPATGRYEIAMTGVAVSVVLESFTVTTADRAALLQWRTAGESGNAGFDIEVAAAGKEFRSVGFVSGFGTTRATNAYRFVVDSLAYGPQTFRLRNLNYDGTHQYSPPVSVLVGPMRSDIVSATEEGPVRIRGLAMVRTRQLVTGAMPRAVSAR